MAFLRRGMHWRRTARSARSCGCASAVYRMTAGFRSEHNADLGAGTADARRAAGTDRHGPGPLRRLTALALACTKASALRAGVQDQVDRVLHLAPSARSGFAERQSDLATAALGSAARISAAVPRQASTASCRGQPRETQPRPVLCLVGHIRIRRPRRATRRAHRRRPGGARAPAAPSSSSSRSSRSPRTARPIATASPSRPWYGPRRDPRICRRRLPRLAASASETVDRRRPKRLPERPPPRQRVPRRGRPPSCRCGSAAERRCARAGSRALASAGPRQHLSQYFAKVLRRR